MSERCSDCGHHHQPNLGGICIGFPCETREVPAAALERPVETSKYGEHDDNCYGRCVDHRDWFTWGTRGLLTPEEAHEVLDMVLNRLAVEIRAQ
jgi:hypothetical protein